MYKHVGKGHSLSSYKTKSSTADSRAKTGRLLFLKSTLLLLLFQVGKERVHGHFICIDKLMVTVKEAVVFPALLQPDRMYKFGISFSFTKYTLLCHLFILCLTHNVLVHNVGEA